MKLKLFIIVLFLCIYFQHSDAQNSGYIRHNSESKAIKVGDAGSNLLLTIDYSEGCRITQIDIMGKNTLSESGVYTGVKSKDGAYFSSKQSKDVKVYESKESVTISNIKYGSNGIDMNESWTFKLAGNKIHWTIEREYNNSVKLDEMEFPQWNFANLNTWKGGIIDNGGMVWCKYLSKVNDTYGVHTGGVTFWNPDSGHAFRITPDIEKNRFVASKFSHSPNNEFTYTQFVTDTELKQRHNLDRFVHQHSDVFAPFDISKGKTTLNLELQYIDYFTEYSRGTLPGIDVNAVRELLNTTGRYGVVDNNIVGANGWITNWKCLHEPFFAQIGMALNDANYTKNMSATLSQEKDLAILEDGRVLSRWHNEDEDEMPGTFNYETGYYEARWGYTVDSQTGYIINTCEQFDLCGDINWLQSHKTSCEKALDWLIRRDSNKNGIFEMKNNNVAEETASDWLDIVWASFENAFVNAQMYEALNLWANCELILGDKQKSEYYYSVASRLKTAFNKPIDKGGFWSPTQKQYVYWRDKDGSVHGDNMVTPVNFAVIAFGLCDDQRRVALILDEIERRTSTENLFHWPLCFDSYKREEVHANNWPFPKYENGDIFPTWGYLGVRAYANYDKEIALKYIRNILEQYNKDGLSSQRYSRTSQLGLGADILAGISTSITALYRDIYGIRPKWNRMGLEPNMSTALNGTEFKYTHLGVVYDLKLSIDNYLMTANDFSIKSNNSFGASKNEATLTYYPFNKEDMQLVVSPKSKHPICMEVGKWTADEYVWSMTSAGNYEIKLIGLPLNTNYRLRIEKESRQVSSGKDGVLIIKSEVKAPATFVLKKLK